MTVSPMRAHDAAEHDGSTIDLDLDLLAGARGSAPPRAASIWSSSSGDRAAHLGDARRVRSAAASSTNRSTIAGRSLARPADTTNSRQRRRSSASALAPSRSSTTAIATLGGERRVGQRHAQLVVALEGPREPEELVLDLSQVTLRRGRPRASPARTPRCADALGHRYRLPTWLM